MNNPCKVRLLNGVLDDFEIPGGKNTIILRGVIDPATLDGISFDTYQREILSQSKIGILAEALRGSSVPDVELGMRGEDFSSKAGTANSEEFILNDPVFGIDGLQRITAAKFLLQKDSEAKPRLGAVVHFNTDFVWERERFRILNQERTKLSANVLLRNLRSENQAVEMLFQLSHKETAFALKGRVQWQQRMLREEIIPALVLAKVVGVLHSRFGAGRSSRYDDLAKSLEGTMKVVSKNVMRENVMTFFDVIDQCFSIRRIVFTNSAPQIRNSFLISVAEVFMRHPQFWQNKQLVVDRNTQLKLAQFPITDPNVAQLASSSGPSKDILYGMLLDHLNKGKRNHLVADRQPGQGAKQVLNEAEPARPVNSGRTGAKALERMGLNTTKED